MLGHPYMPLSPQPVRPPDPDSLSSHHQRVGISLGSPKLALSCITITTTFSHKLHTRHPLDQDFPRDPDPPCVTSRGRYQPRERPACRGAARNRSGGSINRAACGAACGHCQVPRRARGRAAPPVAIPPADLLNVSASPQIALSTPASTRAVSPRHILV